MSKRKTVSSAKKSSGKKSAAKRSKKLKVFTLKLSKWLRGNSANYRMVNKSRLYESKTKTYCCLGMFARQCGIPLNKIRDKGTPQGIFERRADAPDDFQMLMTMRNLDSAIANEAMDVNDSIYTSDEEKITALRPIFRKLGYRIEVVK